MSILKKRGKRANTVSSDETRTRKGNPKPILDYVIAESEILDLVANQPLKNLNFFAELLQVIVEITSKTVSTLDLEETNTLVKDHLDEDDLRLLGEVARDDRSKPYRRLMKAILASVSQGPEGVRSANRTAERALRMLFRWTNDYHEICWGFQSDLSANRYFRRTAEEGRRSANIE